MHTHTHRLTSTVTLCALLALPLSAIAQNAGAPYQRDIVITAYYSPLPDQCCYVRGSYEADVLLNGRGTNGADGTEVYPGMAAAPKSYAFGTRLDVPGVGIFTVHDRGGAIVEAEHYDRIDLWVGAGEEGLARALAFGVRRATATVYPPSAPGPAEQFDLAALGAPMGALKAYVSAAPSMTDLHPVAEQRGPSVSLLQERLRATGHLAVAPTGYFGPATRDALAAFIKDMNLNEPTDSVTDTTGAYLEAAASRVAAKPPVAQTVDSSSAPAVIAQAKRTMRLLGYFSGRTNGTYDDALFSAILKFQQDQALVGDASSPGAGRIGPKTRSAILAIWGRLQTVRKARELLALKEVERRAEELQIVLSQFLSRGEKGDQVKLLQAILAAEGHLPRASVTGLFGPATEAALVAFQVESGIVKSDRDRGAGIVGPATLAHLREERIKELYALVRSRGWSSL